MSHLRLASALAAICLSGLTIQAALAGSLGGPQVIPGVGPGAPRFVGPQSRSGDEPGRYGGGLLEFMMTGRDPTPALRAPRVRVAPGRDYVATSYADPQGGASGYGEPAYAGPAGYEMPRKPLDPMYQRQEVAYDGPQRPGTVVIDTSSKFLYLVEAPGRALRYGIGVGKPGFLWSGEKIITRKAEWPDWTPPAEMMKRRPDLPSHMEGGIANPLGARAMYLGSSLYRIHGTNEPDTIGTNVSSGCIRLTNDDVTDLFGRVGVGTKVIVM